MISNHYAKKKTSTPTKNLRCFVARQFLLQNYALFWRTFCRPKIMVAYQKGQISGMLCTFLIIQKYTNNVTDDLFLLQLFFFCKIRIILPQVCPSVYNEKHTPCSVAILFVYIWIVFVMYTYLHTYCLVTTVFVIIRIISQSLQGLPTAIQWI